MNTTEKHAYCIIAHNEPEMLETLVNTIDDERNDIFLMIDKKTDVGVFRDISPKRSTLFLTRRINVRWGDISLVKAELEVLGLAAKHGPYKVYHLLSGVDLPVKSQDYIHSFVASHPAMEFVNISYDETDKADVINKTRYYHFFTPFERHKIRAVSETFRFIDRLLLKGQKIVGIRRKHDYELVKGHNWASITHPFCVFLLSRQKDILRDFRYVPCADEIYKQSLLKNSTFRMFQMETYDSSMREIDWQRGTPYVWGSDNTDADIEILKTSTALFARKFSMKHAEMVRKVVASLHADP